MRRLIILTISGFLILVFIPYILVTFFSEDESTVRVYIKDEDKVVTMEKNQYLKEVVSAEMPAEFHEEALKAQAVAARTYLKSREGEYKDEHKGADICTDSTHCKAWMSEVERKESWDKEKRNEYWNKISKAVEDTDGELITYDGKPISAVFHSTSSGHTESAEDVWGSYVPYLISVKSDGEELSPNYKSQKTVTKDEFIKTTDDNIENTDWSGDLYSDIKRTPSGGIKEITVGGISIKGTQLRSIFELRSTNITITEENDTITFDVVGNGHGVGMSQYGANYLANGGMRYTDIIKKYYTGVEIIK